MTNKSEKKSETETKAVQPVREFSDDDLRNIQSIDDALELMREVYGAENVFTADQVIGNGFRVLAGREKDRLIGVGLAFVKWNINPSRYNANEWFVSAMVVTEAREKFIINDSGGISKQLTEITETTGRSGGMIARHGLTRSDFTFCEECRSSRCSNDDHEDKRINAFSHYIDVSA